jgi:ribosomal protein S12 methylthiotransferase
MSRPGDGARFLSLIREIRDAVPEAVVRSTIMVGYPGETDEAFEELHDFIRAAELDWAGVFVYSPEEDTPAYRSRKIGPRVAKSVARRRKALLEETQGEITRRRLDRFIGQRLPVLIEENVAGEELAIGRCYAQAPEVDGLVVVRTDSDEDAPGSGRSTDHGTAAKQVQPGIVVEVFITRRNGIDLEGVPGA